MRVGQTYFAGLEKRKRSKTVGFMEGPEDDALRELVVLVVADKNHRVSPGAVLILDLPFTRGRGRRDEPIGLSGRSME